MIVHTNGWRSPQYNDSGGHTRAELEEEAVKLRTRATAEFEKLGADGWELAGEIPWTDFPSHIVFKRPRR